MRRYTTSDIFKKGFIEEVIASKQDYGYCILQLEDGEVKLSTRLLILNILLWRPFKTFGVTPIKDDINHIKRINQNTFKTANTKIYKKLIKLLPDTNHMAIANELMEAINDMYNFTSIHCRPYASTLDIVGLCKMRQDPKIKEIINVDFNNGMGTAIAEKRFKSLSDKFFKLIANEKAIDNNVLHDYAITNTLNRNQLPQLFIAYGPRSDIDDTMMKHVINESAISGLKSYKDFGIEALSVKKASHCSKTVIKQSQYSARKLKLASTPLIRVYPGSCGNTRTIKIYLEKKHKRHFNNKLIVVDGERIELTDDNIEQYVNTTVNLVSPLLCRYTDGICETCAGRGNDDFTKFLPPDIHIGIYAASMVASAVSQMILSAKHLIKTDSLELVLPTNAKYFIHLKNDNIFLNLMKHDINKINLRVPISDIGHLIDLKHKNLAANRFSKIKKFEFVRGDTTIEEIDLVNGEYFILYLTKPFLDHMKNNMNNIVRDNDFVDIPLKGFDISKPFITHVTHNDDMRRFTRRVNKFLSTEIEKYHTVSECLQDFMSVVYEKTGINVLFLEILLRVFMIHNNGRIEIPYVEDPDKVKFAKLSTILSDGAISTKLSFQSLVKYFSMTETSIVPKIPGFLDPIFHFD